MSNAQELVMQDILTLIERKTREINYEECCQTILIPITIMLDELIFYPDEQTVMNSFGSLASLNIMWIPFKNGKDDEKVLLSVLNFLNIMDDKVIFQIPCFFLSKLKKIDFKLEYFN
ncbi:hypothetical protein PYS58_16475 [Chryseobacterium indologenes]|uniref:hypothetical protein n=1 Tax=Chryseobacterium indologenes TaxID=253 RepID=UPI0023E8D3AB|nr:hypothetical protein [Chryseobacterium indologenes]WET48160.1 hypothetical protein PYS58_16475 [Chryseobacterium indologenes]